MTLGFGVVVFLGLVAVFDELVRGALYVGVEEVAVLGLLIVELVDLVVVVDAVEDVLVLPVLVLLVLAVFVLVEVDVLVLLASERAFLSVLIL